MITAQQAYDDLKAYKKDISDIPADTFLSWINYINNFIYRELIGTNSEHYKKVIAINVLKGTSSYALPIDFRDVKHWGTGVYKSSDSNQIDEMLPITMPGSNIRGYYISGNSLVLTPTPQNSDKVFLWYIPKLTKISSFSDPTIIEDEYQEYFTKALDVIYCQWDEGKGDEGFADARFIRCLNEILDNAREYPAIYVM